MDLIDVVEVAECKDAGQIDSRKRRPHRLGPGGQHQRVVLVVADGARLEVLHLDGAVLPVDAADLVPGANLDVQQIAEPLGRGHHQMAPVGDHPAHVIRQSAVGERDLAALLEDEDFGIFIHAAEPGSARRASRYAADDQDSFGHGEALSRHSISVRIESDSRG